MVIQAEQPGEVCLEARDKYIPGIGGLGRLIGEDVEIKLNLQGSLGSVKIDPSQFDQVLNAPDAVLADLEGDGQVQVLWSPSLDQVVVLSNDLADLPAEERYEDALKFWQRALGRDNTNPEYMTRWIETLANFCHQ